MTSIDRRVFLSSLAGSLLPAAAQTPYSSKPAALLPANDGLCWLDVAAPFVVIDPALQLSTEILLTATCFPGIEGYRDSRYATEYQVLLYDSTGKEVHLENNGRFEIPSLRPTVLNVKEWTGADGPFFGGARIRVAPSPHQMPHAGDLFSAGFVRWSLPTNFDNVHAHPAPPEQVYGYFNYSMPFPALSEYHCAFALFNPNDDESFGNIRVVDRMGRTARERKYSLPPHRTTIYTLSDLKTAASPGEAMALAPLNEPKLADGGVLVVRNESPKASFGYTIMRGREGGAFTLEHPLHFAADAPVAPARKSPFGPKGNFPAQAMLFTPMLFRGFRVGELQLETRHYLSSSRWQEEALWMLPMVTTGEGRIAWAGNHDDRLADRVQPRELSADGGVIRLGEFQSCRIATRDLPLPDNFAGGFGVATLPKTSHSLQKVEVRALNWGRVALTHFRPGGASAKSYRQADTRGGLASDYIVSGAHIIGSPGRPKRDTLLAVMNIELDPDQTGTPRIQLFGPSGLAGEKQLGDFPPLACRHFLLSELFPGIQSDPARPFTVRMTVPNAIMIVSALHLDYNRRDLALEHGSDRHSTYQDFKC